MILYLCLQLVGQTSLYVMMASVSLATSSVTGPIIVKMAAMRETVVSIIQAYKVQLLSSQKILKVLESKTKLPTSHTSGALGIL